MDHRMTLTEEEIIRALGMPKAADEEEEGVATVELMEALDYRFNANTILRRLNELIRHGIVEFAGWRSIPDITGRRHPRPVYRLKREE